MQKRALVMSLFLSFTAQAGQLPSSSEIITECGSLFCKTFEPKNFVNFGIGFGMLSVLRADYQIRSEPDLFWTITAGTIIFFHTLNASVNWKNVGGWSDSGYWLLGSGVSRSSLPADFLGHYSYLLPEFHIGWGYEVFTDKLSRHAFEIRVSYPEVCSAHYLFGL